MDKNNQNASKEPPLWTNWLCRLDKTKTHFRTNLCLNDRAYQIGYLFDRFVLLFGQSLENLTQVNLSVWFEANGPPSKLFQKRFLRNRISHPSQSDHSLQRVKTSRSRWDLISTARNNCFHSSRVLIHCNVMEGQISLLRMSTFDLLRERGEFFRVKAPLCVFAQPEDTRIKNL